MLQPRLTTLARFAPGFAGLVLALMVAGPLAAQSDPVIEAIVNSPRRSPADTARAFFALIDAGAVEAATPILAELVSQQLDDAAIAALVEEFGSARFLRLSADSRFGPEANAFAERCLQAAAAQSRDPARLSELVERLAAPNAADRATALVDLRTTGLPGAEFLLVRLAAANDQSEQNRVRQALERLTPTSTPLLLGALESGDDTLTTQAAIALAQAGETQAAPLLAVLGTTAPAESNVNQAARWAYQRLTGHPLDFADFEAITSRAIERLLAGGPAGPTDADGQIAISRWDNNTKQPVTARLPVADAAVVLAAPLAGGQAAVFGDRTNLVRRAAVLKLEARAVRRRTGLPVDKDDTIDSLPSYQLSGALADAVRNGRSGAAVALCDAIAKTRDIGVLATESGRPSPLAAALDAPHPAVRFAALQAIMQLNPPGPFPGSSRVAPALTYFAAGEGEVVAVVATPNLERSATLGSRLAPSNIVARVTNRGDEAIALAAAGPDVQAVFVDMAILRPHARETLFRLRRQTASAGVPIALTAGAGRLDEADRIAAEHTRVLAVPRPHDDLVIGQIVGELAELLPADWPGTNARRRHALLARQWLAKLRADGPAFYRVPAANGPLVTPTDTPADTDPLPTPPPTAN